MTVELWWNSRVTKHLACAPYESPKSRYLCNGVFLEEIVRTINLQVDYIEKKLYMKKDF